jgi:Fur family ferric uptake transcriptional regulator
VEDATEKLRSSGLRMGHARRRVLDVLGHQAAGLSAEAIAEQVPDVHVSSVYRALAVLEDLELVSHVHLGHGPALYELSGPAAGNRHLVCQSCGRDIVVPNALFDELRQRVSEDYDFALDAGHFAVLGRCGECERSSLLRP